ncbi:MAG: hypothetical protein LBQ83_02215 [Candidatus Margulisbacteria bacterium]|jgi:UDP-N-acetylglucosamine diphosphorylase/glucosamine-1-phosphate N-acetyltransferase|nr:hypothetical protein [Candidatus Margulisiibacteriota bacterium]
MQVCIFEDTGYANLLPLTHTRPVYLLRLGIKDLLSKILDYVPGHISITLHCRGELKPLLKTLYKYPVNELAPVETIFINGRIIAEESIIKNLRFNSGKNFLIAYNEMPLIARLDAKLLKKFKIPGLFNIKTFRALKLPETSLNIPLVNYYWELLGRNGKDINIDSGKTGLLGKHNSSTSFVHLVNARNIFIGQDVLIKPGVVLDASGGAIFIDNKAEVLANAVINGPAYIGYKTIVKAGARIYGGTSLGPVCKIGGEVENSIVHGYANKQHEGFLGHSYLGEWVNLGAGTETSDLKNNYQQIKIQITAGKIVNSQLQFAGCCIGDHTRTGIKTMLGAGAVLGCFCNVLGPGFQPKYLPSFAWHDNARPPPEEYQLEKALQTARLVLLRRGLALAKEQENLYRQIFQNSAEERRKLKLKINKRSS